MELSKYKLIILSDKLLEITGSEKFNPQKRDGFICDPEFEDMLCLATDINSMEANKIYQKIYADIDNTMGSPLLIDVIKKHIADL